MDEYQINDYFEYQFPTQIPATSAVSDADELPTYIVFKAGSDDLVATGTCAKRASRVGYYYAREQITSPKYEVNSDYNVRVVAAVLGVTGASKVGVFRVVSADSTRSDVWTNVKASYLDAPISSRAVSGDAMNLQATAIDAIFAHNVQSYSTEDNSAGAALKAAWAQGFGKWTLVGTTLTLYGPDGTTVVRQFALDNALYPTSRTPI